MRKNKTRPFDAANYLQDEADVTAYLQAAMDDGDPTLLVAAFGDIAEARRHASARARHWPVAREPLQESVERTRAEFGTMFKVIHAMGFKIHLTPLDAGG